jgi:hypothetical protein
MIKVPEKCLCCKSKWNGGSAIPGDTMEIGLRVFFSCGASLSVAEDLGCGCYMLRFKNCQCEECRIIPASDK